MHVVSSEEKKKKCRGMQQQLLDDSIKLITTILVKKNRSSNPELWLIQYVQCTAGTSTTNSRKENIVEQPLKRNKFDSFFPRLIYHHLLSSDSEMK